MRRQFRVLLVGPLPPPVGGMASVVQSLASALSDSMAVRVINNVKRTAVDRPLWQGAASQLRLVARLATACAVWRPAIVHIHTCSFFSYWRNSIDVLTARLLGRKVVLHIHGGRFTEFLGSLGPMAAFAARATLGLAHKVVVLGDYARGPMSLWVRAERIEVVPNGVLAGDLVPRHLRADFHIACLASYEGGRKGQGDLLRAVARMRQPDRVHVRLAGVDNTPGERAALTQLAGSLGLGARVTVGGPIVGEAKIDWWRDADCFCLPSYAEALPMTMLEAMAIGLPVVVTRVGAVSEVVRDGSEGLLFEPGDLPALTRHLQVLMDDTARRDQTGLAGRQRVLTGYSLAASAKRLEFIYRSLIDDPDFGSSTHVAPSR